MLTPNRKPPPLKPYPTISLPHALAPVPSIQLNSTGTPRVDSPCLELRLSGFFFFVLISFGDSEMSHGRYFLPLPSSSFQPRHLAEAVILAPPPVIRVNVNLTECSRLTATDTTIQREPKAPLSRDWESPIPSASRPMSASPACSRTTSSCVVPTLPGSSPIH